MGKKPEKPNEPETTGHSWDGIEEYNNPLPRWWLWTFYATIVWGVIYTIAYPAWPLVNRATPPSGRSTRSISSDGAGRRPVSSIVCETTRFAKCPGMASDVRSRASSIVTRAP